MPCHGDKIRHLYHPKRSDPCRKVDFRETSLGMAVATMPCAALKVAAMHSTRTPLKRLPLGRQLRQNFQEGYRNSRQFHL